eukprot:gene6860-8530_t
MTYGVAFDPFVAPAVFIALGVVAALLAVLLLLSRTRGALFRALALAAGADGFLDKPLENMAQLCRVLRPLLPELDIHPPPMAPGEAVAPDPLALRDDLAFAQRALQGRPDADRRRYVSAFVAGIARHSQDAALAAVALHAADEAGLAPLR